MQLTVRETRARELFSLLLRGAGTEPQRQEYIARYQEEAERKMGKPLFELTAEEFEQYKALEENLSFGRLEGYKCRLCRNKGYTVVRDGIYTIHRACTCMTRRSHGEVSEEQREFENLLTTRTFENFKINSEWQKDMLKRAKAWTRQTEYPFLYIGGKTSTGKTHLAIAALYSLMQRGFAGKYVSWRKESRDLKMRMTEYGYYDSKLKALKTATVLLIDDFLWQPNGAMPSDEDFRLAKEIIDARSNIRLMTIFTSNYTLRDLTEITEEIGSRIYQACGSTKNFVLTVGKEAKNYRMQIQPTLMEIEAENPFEGGIRP